MKPFLKQVARHYYNGGDIQKRCFIFPNRRSMIFFRKYLCEEVAASGKDPIVAPQMLSINDFFSRLSGMTTSGRIRLLVELYECYCRLNPNAESLDEFIFWGDVLLGDFNDVDKYLVDPQQLFCNISEYKDLQDDYTYLTQTQKDAINAFIKHFKDDSGKLTVNIDTGDADVKGRFLMIWNLLLPLYTEFGKVLKAKDMAYEGMMYRSLVEKFSAEDAAQVLRTAFPREESFVFVGLNALNECEKAVLRKLRNASLAEFCWDWSGDMIRNPQNRSSFFM